MESNTLPLTKEKLGQVINQQLYTINCLVNERIWLTEQLSMYHDTIIQWQQYAQSLETDLQRRQKEQAKVEEAHSQLDIKYHDLKWIYWQVNRKYEKCKAEFKYGMEVGESVCAEYLYYKQSYTELLEHYRQLWSACYARPSGSGQEQERSDHGTAQKSTAVLPLNLKSRKIRSSPSKGEVPPLAFPCIMSFKEDNITSPGLRSKPGQAAVIHLFPNQSVLDSLGLKRKAVRSLQSPPEAPPIVDIKQENSSHLLPCAISSVRFSSDKLEELELPQFEDKSSSIFPKAPSSVDLAKDELEVVEALQLPEKTVGLTKAKLEVAESPQLKIEYWSSFCYEEDDDECEPHSENAKATECVDDSEVTEAVEGTHEMFVSDEVDRSKGERAAEPASKCHNTANDDVELDCSSQFNGDEPQARFDYEFNCEDLSAKPKKSRTRRFLSWVRKRLACVPRKDASN